MADAPSGGGSSWGPIEIIAILLLGIGFMSTLTGNPIASPGGTSTTPPQTIPKPPVQNPNDPKCGLSLSHPTNLESVFASVPIIGSVSGCNWIPTESSALSAQVIDANGIPLSGFVAVPISARTGAIASFATTIAFTTAPATSTGYVILIPASDPAYKNITTRIQIKFAR